MVYMCIRTNVLQYHTATLQQHLRRQVTHSGWSPLDWNDLPAALHITERTVYTRFVAILKLYCSQGLF